MAEATREEVIVWVLESAGLHMRADTTEAGKLVRLADVVRRLMLVNELPRVEAVEALCTALETAPVPPTLFRAYSGRRAELLEGDAALFGFHTEETWAKHRAAMAWQRIQEARESNRFASTEWSERGLRFIGWPPPEPVAAPAFVVPGVPAAVRYIRENWPVSPRIRLDGTSVRDALDYVRGRAFGLSIRLSDAQALWGGHSEPVGDADAPVELATYADLVRHRQANPGTSWDTPENQIALLRAEVDRGARVVERGLRKRIGAELGASTQRIAQLLNKELGKRASVHAKAGGNVTDLDTKRRTG